MEISVKSEGRCMEIYLKGELDHHGAKGMMMRLDRELELALPLQLVLDFSGVAFMDSSGIGLIIGRYKLMSRRGGSVAVSCRSGKVDRIFEMAGLYQLVERLA